MQQKLVMMTLRSLIIQRCFNDVEFDLKKVIIDKVQISIFTNSFHSYIAVQANEYQIFRTLWDKIFP